MHKARENIIRSRVYFAIIILSIAYGLGPFDRGHGSHSSIVHEAPND